MIVIITFTHQGNFDNLEKFLKKNQQSGLYKVLLPYARQGVEALRNATPKDTGKTADSWSYEIVQNKKSVSITWTNSNFNKGVPVALVIQYGHAMPNGGYVQGIDYINPALKPIFDKMLNEVWREVTSK